MADVQVDRMAAQMAEDAFRRTQNVSDALDDTLYAAVNKFNKGIGRVLFPFSSDPLKGHNQLRRAIMSGDPVQIGRTTAGIAGNMALAAAVNPLWALAGLAVANLFGGDEEDEEIWDLGGFVQAMALAPLHARYGINRVIVSTYQSITGTGVKAMQQMENERAGISGEMAYHYPIDKNCIPQCDSFLDNGYTKEEMKLTNETKKILDPRIDVVATAVRVPVVGGHSEAVNIEFDTEFELDEVRKLLEQTPGIVVQDNLETFEYPMPKFAEGKDAVFVGRIRRDFTRANTLNLWIVADNLRKGAATNAVQIAKLLLR